MARVTVWFRELDEPVVEDMEVDYVSFVNPDTHGIPALLSGRAATTVEAENGQTILYVNTALVPLLEVEK